MTLIIVFLSFIFAVIITYFFQKAFSPKPIRRTTPVSVNYHFTRKCNKSCGFCFHTATSSHIGTPEKTKIGLRKLREAGMRKINFAGGEPFLYPKFLGTMTEFCKQELALESVSVVSNGSKITRMFLERYGRFIDIIAVSCDSFDEQTNIAIGRGAGDQVTQLFRVRDWCREMGIKFKLNTVVCRLNHTEDMNIHIQKLAPFRWKVFQVLMVVGENDSDKTLRDVRGFMISDKQFDSFCNRHARQKCLVPEPNRLMAKSYLILNEYMQFLDRDGRIPSESILDVPVEDALAQVFWDEQAFISRGGVYDWNKETGGCGNPIEKDLEW